MHSVLEKVPVDYTKIGAYYDLINKLTEELKTYRSTTAFCSNSGVTTIRCVVYTQLHEQSRVQD